MNRKRLLAALAVFALMLAACTEAVETTTTPVEATAAGETTTAPGGETTTTGPAVQAEGGVLAAVQDRGTLNCGVNDAVPGFGFQTAEGTFEGFDIDYCHAVAAAVLGDPEAVEFIPLTAQQRFTALQSGEIDVLIRNTTWTSSRDGTEGATFATTTFYDGQGMMVRTDSGIAEMEDLANLAVCVLSGTTTELNLASRFIDIPHEPLTFDDNEQLQAAFVAGQCDGWTSDKSQLAGVRSNFPDAEGGPEALTILEETFSKEPLGPVTRDGDSQWSQIVDWVVIVTIQAEEFGITSENIDTFEDTDDLAIRRLLGLEFEDDEGNIVTFDSGLGLDVGWAAEVIRQVGNYAEIYERNVGPDTPLGLQRGVNSLWTDGGLLYAPPFR
ncbi:MAG TPA: amino acid ABC transporter substrate-binding protein [Acidimicrobiia bacterium]|nr:amino acid ABC transporter substrate-binding protein [Acidimicrobiia bacterium]